MADLETIIAALVERKKALPLGSKAREFCDRQLAGLRYSHEEAGGIIEDLDRDWGANCRLF